MSAGFPDIRWLAQDRVLKAEAWLQAASVKGIDTGWRIVALYERGEDTGYAIQEHADAQRALNRARYELSAARKALAGLNQ